MANFPSNWLEFADHKEIKRLRRDLADKDALRVQVAISVIIAILAFFLEDVVSEWLVWQQVLIILGMVLAVAAVFMIPILYKYIKFRRGNNVILNGQKASNIFDDEIVYDVMVAVEFYESMNCLNNGELKKELEQFYKLEIEYYISKSMKALAQMTSSYRLVFGEKFGQISLARVKNIIKLIDELSAQCNPIIINDSVVSHYKTFVGSINLLS